MKHFQAKANTTTTPRKKHQQQPLEMINPHAAGIDIGSERHWVAVPSACSQEPVRSFGCFTADLHAMAQWLKNCGIKTIAMESTGVYWIAPFQILEDYGFEVKLVNARHVKNVPGRKTDVQDCQWLQRLHSYGLLSGSFRPEAQICVLRSYWRHRETLVRYASAHIQHMQKALTQMNLHLHKVISDISGVSGMKIIRAIIAGERDPQQLALLREPGVKNSAETIAKALQGDYRPEHLFALRQAVELYEFYQSRIEACDRQIASCLSAFESKADAAPLPSAATTRKRRKNQPYIDLRGELYRICGIDFTSIPGLDSLTVQTIVSEVGLDPGRFAHEKRFTSWLALCPHNRITGGKIHGSKTKKTNNRATIAFRLAAQSLANSTSALGGFYRRIRSRLGGPTAVTATAHKLARIFYRMWSTGQPYVEQGANRYEAHYKERVLKNIVKRAKQLGYDVILHPVSPGVA